MARVLLDGEPVALPGKSMRKLSTVRAQLELLALRKDRILASLMVDGVPVDLQHTSLEWQRFQEVEARTISFGELGVSMITSVHREALLTMERIQQAGSQVLINDWPAVCRLVRRLESETRTLLLVIGFIDELCSEHVAIDRVDVQSIREHIDGMEALRNRLNTVMEHRDAEELTDFLMLSMAPWVGRLAELLHPSK